MILLSFFPHRVLDIYVYFLLWCCCAMLKSPLNPVLDESPKDSMYKEVQRYLDLVLDDGSMDLLQK